MLLFAVAELFCISSHSHHGYIWLKPLTESSNYKLEPSHSVLMIHITSGKSHKTCKEEENMDCTQNVFGSSEVIAAANREPIVGWEFVRLWLKVIQGSKWNDSEVSWENYTSFQVFPHYQVLVSRHSFSWPVLLFQRCLLPLFTHWSKPNRCTGLWVAHACLMISCGERSMDDIIFTYSSNV